MNKLHAKLASSKLKYHEGYDESKSKHGGDENDIAKHFYSLRPFKALFKQRMTKSKETMSVAMPMQAMMSLILLKISTLTNKYAISVKNAVKMMLSTFLRMVMSASSFFIGSLYPSKLNLI